MVLPKPDYDSGWVQTHLAGPPPSPPASYSLRHNLGTTDLLVQIVDTIGHGAPNVVVSSPNTWVLTPSEIKVTVRDFGMEFRVRLWFISPI